MPRLTCQADIRRLLETDRPWAIYALGDLTPGYFEHSEWYGAEAGAPGLALLYRAFATPVLLTVGEPRHLRPVLAEIGTLPKAYLSIRPEVLSLVCERHRVEDQKAMWRMVLAPGDFRPEACGEAVRLELADLPALEALYADGGPAGETPDFFSASMVADGAFFGLWEAGRLVSVAGTHLVSPQESVGAVGNVYTRRDRRGRGLAGRVSSAVTAELLRLGLRTIALNVNQQNEAAIRVYERLGYRKYCEFCEGVAVAHGQEQSETRKHSG